MKTLLDSVAAFDFSGKNIAILNAVYHPELSIFSDSNLILQQYFKPYEAELVNAGFLVSPYIPDNIVSYNIVCVLLPKNMMEARYLIARGIVMLASGGILVCAADNKSGGTRIKKLLEKFGVCDLSEHSKNKARCVFGMVKNIDEELIIKSINEGKKQNIIDEMFVSVAGIFGWNKIDKGSELLTKYIPKNFKGRGADFGCGYGYLSHFILSNCSKIKQLTCIDADYRAVEICHKNLSQFECNKDFLWSDLTKPNDNLKNLDFIIMNPPFHEGKNVDTSVGTNFINNAYQSLRRGGSLFMVANNHLAYENTLNEKFFKCHKLYEGQGFKVFEALK